MPCIKAQITRYVDDEPQPGIVECAFVDASGRTHRFLEKTAIVTGQVVSAASVYPIACLLGCEVEDAWEDPGGDMLLRICTERPYDMVSADGESRFVVHASQVLREP